MPTTSKYLDFSDQVLDMVNCPYCGAYISDRSLISKTEIEFAEDPEPHYAWIETHKCTKCESTFRINNRT